jgi:hypothetical protein
MAKYATKKRVIVVAVAALTIGLGASAFAYFTSTGSGTGSATVGTSTAVQLSSPSVGPLYPGGADVPVTVSVHNPGGGNEYVNQITGSVATSGSCLGTWFVVDPINYAAEVAHGATNSAPTNVRMLNVNASQDACQGQTLTINWSSN